MRSGMQKLRNEYPYYYLKTTQVFAGMKSPIFYRQSG